MKYWQTEVLKCAVKNWKLEKLASFSKNPPKTYRFTFMNVLILWISPAFLFLCFQLPVSGFTSLLF